LEENYKNQDSNSQDGGGLSWDRLFQDLVRWYGVKKGFIGPDEDEQKYQTHVMKGCKETPLSYGPSLTVRKSCALAA